MRRAPTPLADSSRPRGGLAKVRTGPFDYCPAGGIGSDVADGVVDAQSQADSALAQLSAAKNQLSAAEAAAKAAALRLEETVIRAPFTGTVVKKLADEGAVLAPAAVSEINVGGIIQLVDLSDLDVEAEVSEDRLETIHEGQPTLIFLDAYRDKVFRGEAGTLRPSIDRAKATAIVKVKFATTRRACSRTWVPRCRFWRARSASRR